MIDEILDNLIYIDNKKEIKELLESNISVDEYLNSNYNRLINRWHKEYPMFDIPSGLLAINIDGNLHYYNVGNKKYNKNTIFDIASMSKLYTEIMLINVLKEYNLTMDTKIKDVVSFYEKINELSFGDLISFGNTFLTSLDIRNCKNKEEAIKALRTIYIDEEYRGFYQYTDLPIMVIADILETLTNMSYKKLFDKYIIDMYDLKETYLEVDSEDYLTINKKGVNDPKANIMGGYYGHAGVKVTSGDFSRFLKIISDNKILDKYLVRSKYIRKEDNLKADNVAIIGNLSLGTKDGISLASIYSSKKSYTIQGSVRCHAESNEFIIDGKSHFASFCFFCDLYTQYENAKEYEKVSGKTITKEYEVDKLGKLKLCDIRSLLSYKVKPGFFKEIIDVISKSKLIELYNSLNEK